MSIAHNVHNIMSAWVQQNLILLILSANWGINDD